MIPSDHFVRFYNEVFKFLDRKGGDHLQNYWLEISRHQERHCLELFKTKGLQGMYEYWEHIRIEENCDMEITMHDGWIEFYMKKCPSLTKAIDNDAEPCEKYCDHCPGWVGPLMKKAGFFYIKDMIARDVPECRMYICETREKAEELKRKVIEENGLIVTNF